MNDLTISKKIADKYVPMITLKEGWKVGLSPAFKKELVAWLKDPQENWLNFNLKDWGSQGTGAGTTQSTTAGRSAHDQAKSNGHQPQNAPVLDDEIPF